MNILVTGASGKTGKAVINVLNFRGHIVRALIRNLEKREAVEISGAAEVVVADLGDISALSKAMEGVDGIYHISPNVSPWEVVYGKNALSAAKANGIKHFVYHSVFHPNIQKMPHHWLKLRVEEAIFESGLEYTILQPAAYMQNVLAQLESITQRGIYPTPYPVNTPMSLVDLDDVAEVAGAVLGNSEHFGAIYELVGPDKLTQTDIATIMGQVLGRIVTAQEIPLSEWKHRARVTGLTGYSLRTLIAMFEYYRQFGFCGNTNVLSWLLRRPPTDFRTFFQKVSS